MQALVVGEVGKQSWEQSPLFLLQRLVPIVDIRHIQIVSFFINSLHYFFIINIVLILSNNQNKTYYNINI